MLDRNAVRKPFNSFPLAKVDAMKHDPIHRTPDPASRPLKVAIATTTRFHVTDLARELSRNGAEVQFISYVPRTRALTYGVQPGSISSILPALAPIIAWERYLPWFAPKLRGWLRVKAINGAARLRLHRCDVFICMSGTYLEAARFAKDRFGAQVWLERGSTHIRTQRDILSKVPGARLPSELSVAREEAGYALADRILVASTHVHDSFLERAPELSNKIIRIPYGVNVEEFPLQPRLPAGPPWKLIFVGGWSLRKGCDVLIEALRGMDDIELIHVGGLGDVSFPHDDPRFQHIGMVPQSRLAKYYAKAHVAVLASREEGLAMVQAQSLATGLPLIGTTMSGARDLRLSETLARNITVCDVGDAAQLRASIRSVLNAYTRQEIPTIQEIDRMSLTWSRYGADYFRALSEQVRPSEK